MRTRRILLAAILICSFMIVAAFMILTDTSKTPMTTERGAVITTLASGLDDPRFVAVSGGFVYFTELTGGRVQKVDVDGRNTTTLASEEETVLKSMSLRFADQSLGCARP